jgi:hypothetical protein
VDDTFRLVIKSMKLTPELDGGNATWLGKSIENVAWEVTGALA